MSEIADRLGQLEPDVRFQLLVPEGVPVDGYSASVLDVKSASAWAKAMVADQPSLVLNVGFRPIPAMITQCDRSKTPIALVEPTLKPAQDSTWLWRKTRLAPALRMADRIWARTQEEVDQWIAYGARPTRTSVGSQLSPGYAATAINEQEREHIASRLVSRPVWFIHQLPKDELGWALKAIQTAQRSWPRLVTLIEPGRDLTPSDLRTILKDAGLITHSRDVEGEPNEQTQAFITDDADEAGLWYRLAALTYLGGTLSGKPPPNPMIGASAGSALIHGPRLLQHRSAFDRLIAGNATKRISHGDHLGDAVAEHMAPDQCANLAHNGWQVMSEGAEMSNQLMDYIAETLNLTLDD